MNDDHFIVLHEEGGKEILVNTAQIVAVSTLGYKCIIEIPTGRTLTVEERFEEIKKLLSAI